MKIFFCDLDGTLLRSDRTISAETKKAIDAFVEAGNCFVISTGRALSSALILRDRYGLTYPGSYLSAFNGAILYDNTNECILHQTGLPLEIVEELAALADQYGLHIQSYREPYIVSRSYCDDLAYYMMKTSMPCIIDPDFIRELDPFPPKVLAIDIHHPERLYPMRDEVMRRFPDQIDVVFSEPSFCEFISKSAGKGKSLRKLCDILQVPLENSLAAGDDENDIPMILEAGTGIAMKNAAEAVRSAADVITEKDNDHDGLIPFLLA